MVINILLLPEEKLCCRACTRSWSRRQRCRRTWTCRCCPSWWRWRSGGSPPRPPSDGRSWSSSRLRSCSGINGIMKELTGKIFGQFAAHWCMFVFSLIFATAQCTAHNGNLGGHKLTYPILKVETRWIFNKWKWMKNRLYFHWHIDKIMFFQIVK